MLIVSTHKTVWSINLKFKIFGIFLLESFLMCFFVCLAFLKRRLLRAVFCKDRLRVCKIEKSDFPKLCQKEGLGELFLKI